MSRRLYDIGKPLARDERSAPFAGNTIMPRPLCFIAMPFGRKEAGGRSVEFDDVWHEVIEPAITAADMEPLRADEEWVGGIIHKPMFERLVLCEFAVCDLTLANPNVFYELGVRHAARAATTVLVIADDVRLPFDIAMLRTLPYRLGPDGKPTHAGEDAQKLGRLLLECRTNRHNDSPLFQLLDGVTPLEVPSDRTDVFRREADYAAAKKAELAAARKKGREAVAAVRGSLGPLDAVESGVLVDLLLSYRAVKDWPGMIDLVAALPETLRRTVLVQEQLGFALNRAGRGDEAEQVLTNLIALRGPSSETLGILGRVYKDRWEAADQAGERFEAAALMDKAIDAYRRGFEADWRDHYPGINAVTLMELHDPPDPERLKLDFGRALRGRATHRRQQARVLGLGDHAGAGGAREGRTCRGQGAGPSAGGDPRNLGTGDYGAQSASHPRGARPAR